jgi:hypothetical protein
MMEPERRTPSGTRVLLPIVIIAMAVIIALLVALVCGGDEAENERGTQEPTPDAAATTAAAEGGLQQALAQFAQGTLNGEYAGDCAQAAGGPAGKLCSTKRGERQNVQAYVFGATQSEPTQWALLEQRNGVWQVVYAPKITSDTRAVPGIPWPPQPGAEVVVIGTGNCLNIRTEPRIAPGNAVDCVADGTRITLARAGGPIDANDQQWWQVEGRAGWISADYLRYPDAIQ